MSHSRTCWRRGLLASTVSAAAFCSALPSFAQTPGGSEQPAGTQGTLKTAVQKEIEDLYRKNGRPLPEYMQGDGDAPAPTAAQPAPAAAPRAPQLPKSQPAATPVAAPNTASASKTGTKSVREQLAEYYAGEGKTMPTAQRADAQTEAGAARPPLQQTAAATETVPVDGKEAVAPPKKRRLIDRLNPFRRLTKEAPAPQASAPATKSAPAVRSLEPALPQDGPVARRRIPPATNEFDTPQAAPTRPQPGHRLVPVQPSTLEPAPIALPQPTVQPRATAQPLPMPAPAAVVSPAPQPASKPAPDDIIFSLTDQPTTAPAAAPATPQTQQPAPAPAATKKANPRDDDFPNPFGAESEKQADAEQDPFTGLTLDDRPAKTEPKSATPASPSATAPAATEAAPTKAAGQAPAKAENEPNPFTVDEAAKPAPLPAADATVAKKADAAPIQQAVPAQAEPSREARASESTSAPKRKAASTAVADGTAAQMRKINERFGLAGFKGFCPVCLRDDRQLVDSQPRFTSIHNLKPYEFSSAAAKAAFERSPEKYSPAADGIDVVIKANSDQQVDGTLDFAVWYKDRLYLFSSPESLETFSLNPSQYAAK